MKKMRYTIPVISQNFWLNEYKFNQYRLTDIVKEKSTRISKQNTDWREIFKTRDMFGSRQFYQRTPKFISMLMYMFLDFIVKDIIVNNNRFFLNKSGKFWRMAGKKFKKRPGEIFYRLIADGRYSQKKYLKSIQKLRKKKFKHIMVLGGKYNHIIGEQRKKGQQYV